MSKASSNIWKNNVPATPSVKSILGKEGLFQSVNPSFSYRSSQQAMGEAVEEAVKKNERLVVEAATGIGKTFAYLVPAILSGKKILISTATKHLQDQLFFRDIPEVLKLLETHAKKSLLKGRNNYLCLYRLQESLSSDQLYTKRELDELMGIHQWSSKTKEGDLSNCSAMTDGSPLFSAVTSTTEACLNKECPYVDECFVFKARQKALKSELLVINHHLFFADYLLGEDSQLFQDFEVVIFDEAHQLPDTARQFIGEHVGSRELHDLALDIRKAVVAEAPDADQLIAFTEKLELRLKSFRLALGEENSRIAWSQVANVMKVIEEKSYFVSVLEDLVGLLNDMAERGKSLALCAERMSALASRFQKYGDEKECNTILWLETFKQNFTLHSTPLQFGDELKKLFSDASKSWIFTSATLTANNSFDYFSERLGLEDYRSHQFQSDYNYASQAMLYMPRGLPKTNHESFNEQLFDAIRPVIDMTEGHAFLLFTSFAALNRVAELCRELLSYRLFVQGDAPRSVLIENFRQEKNAVLLGTASFWQGVDIPGNQLSCVVIDKLPFASPGDPIHQAKIALLKEQGKNAFYTYQLPSAIIQLKQGVGRLIRDKGDCGIIVICDPRLVQRSYGQVFIQSLPPMKRTRDFATLREFYYDCDTRD